MSSWYNNFVDEPQEADPSQFGSTKLEEYNRFVLPPNITMCEKHMMANSTGEDDTTKEELCPCCGFRVYKKNIAMCDSTLRLSFLGSGYPLFFLFMKCCMVILASMLAIFGGAAMYFNYNGGACMDPVYKDQCFSGYQTLLSFWNAAKLDTHAVYVEQYLCLAVILVLIVLMQIMRFQIRKTAEECDQGDISASDYTIFVENIPKGLNIDYQAELKSFFESLKAPGLPNLVVMKIVLAHDLREQPLKERDIDVMAAAKSKAYEEKFKKGSFPPGVTEETLEADIIKMTEEMTNYMRSFDGNMDRFAGVAFVSFQNETMKRILLETYKFSKLRRFRIAFKQYLCVGEQKTGLVFNGNTLFIKQAVEPLDVCWENLGLSDKERYLRAFLGPLLALGLIIGTAALIYYLTVQQQELSKENADDIKTQVLVKLLNTLASLGVVILNKFLSWIMPVIVAKEKNRSLSETYGSVARKLALVLFLSTGFISFLICTFYVDNDYATSSGLIPTIIQVLIMNCGFYSLMNFINPGLLIQLYKKNKLRKDASKWAMTQLEANHFWENPNFEMDTIAANMINILQVTCFFALLVPLGLVFSLLFFIFNYWIYKFALLKRSCIKNELGKELIMTMTNIMDLCIVFFAISVFVFNKVLAGDAGVNQVTILILVIGITHFLVPTQSINKWLFRIETVDEVMEYEQASRQFDTDYERSNPLTKVKVREERVKKSNMQRP